MKENIQWYKIIIDNWTQVIFILGAIIYIIKLLINWDIKKREISFTKVQEKKLIEIKEFYKSYQTLRISLEHFLNQTEFGEHSTDILNEIRVKIRENYVDFDYKCMTLKLFMKKEDIITIESIIYNCELIRKHVEKWHIYKSSLNPPSNWDKLPETRNEILNKNLPNLMKKIETSLRKSYYID
ncbi:hypothetical protein [Tenacibaculum finnmarkense]|uniref:hypothetical protein n=1 Tax=Tenacibaculum finnmarkense TaxID=2781243 RepID=UPI000C446917|nr:hypothetical protein [Tenacibaculum finnmarkense]MCD8440635.1 hypothetical protein [Tenacibaculum finnmarkense genomovar ulcerans]MCG8721476.1 hypothetical protein [Tenacibaculum finnmarkense]SOS55345.1 hypothetical protein TFHFJT_280035 [Tenacibaculum finnmarkense]